MSLKHCDVFSKIIFVMVQEHNKVDDKELKHQIYWSIYKTVWRWSMQTPQMVSEKALEYSKEKGINPWELQWKDRKKFGKNSKGKSNCMWEHSVPVSYFIKKSILKCTNEKQVLECLLDYPGACWIMREEDDLLNSSGYKSVRPGGWLKCYESIGINVVYKSGVEE